MPGGSARIEVEESSMSQMALDGTPVVLALQRNGVPALRRLEVEETDAAVVLRGTVGSYYLKQLAQEAVMPLLAGRKLINRVEVVRE
jgi:hypothetical protein